jgi:ATP/maltotriose-dependent transcriptional regulator MalT
MHLLQGSFSELQTDLDELEPLLKKNWRTAEQRNTFRAEWLVIRSLMAVGHGELEQCRAYLDEAASLAPEGNLRVLSMIQYGQASVHRLSADPSAADAYFRQAIASGQKSGNLIAEMLSTTGLADLEFEQGELNTAYAILKPVSRRLVSSPRLPPISNVIYGLLGEIHFQWCELEKAGQFFQQGYRLSVFGGLQSGIISYRLLLSRLALLSGDLEAAVLEVEKAQQSASEELPAYLHQEMVSQLVRVFLAQDRPDRAEALLTDQGFSFHPEYRYPDINSGDRISYSSGLLYQSSLEVLLQRSREAGARVNFQPGIELADRILGDDYQMLPILTRIGMLLKRARMLALCGVQEASQQDYRQAVEAGSVGNLLGIFLEEGPGTVEAAIQLKKIFPADDGIRQYLLRLQAAAEKLQQLSSGDVSDTSDKTHGRPNLAEPLTDRELDVLAAMQEGLTYQEIGSRLFISLNTVRYHIKAIYGKLNVNNRTLAIEKARQLKLI